MDYRFLAKEDMKISRIGLGTRQLFKKIGNDKSKAALLFDTALDKGINLFVTAYHYDEGFGERIIGENLSNVREDIIIATSAGVYRTEKGIKIDLSPKALEEQLEITLKNLQTDYIDLFQLHHPDIFCDRKETINFLHEQVEADRVKAIGVTNFNINTLKEWAELEIASIQMPYNPIQREIESEYFDYCAKNSIAIFAYTPLCAGLLTGKKLDLKQHPLVSILDPQEIENFELILKEFEKCSKELDLTIPQIIMAWISEIDELDSILVGTSSPSHLVENISGFEKHLSSTEREVIGEIMKKAKKLFPNGFTIKIPVDKIHVSPTGVRYTKAFGAPLEIPQNISEGDTIIMNDTTGKIVDVIKS